MNSFDEYRHFVRSKATTPIACSFLGLAGEVGEVIDYIKKVEYHGHTVDRLKLINELGDVLFYLTDIADRYCECSLGDCADANVDKLNKRYKGAFTKEESVARVDVK